MSLTINKLNVVFNKNESFHAIKDLDLFIPSGKTLALLGQSGSGKSITSFAVMGLLPPNADVSGEIIINNDQNNKTSLLDLSDNEWQKVRGKLVSMVFQEPMSALNPLMTCGAQLVECILTHQPIDTKAAKKSAIEWLNLVKLPNPTELFNRYPHQLSGGQKQRIVIAMAMCNHPSLLIADEPTTALDVTVQKEIILLMKSLQQQFGMSMLFITHDLLLAKQIADDVCFIENGLKVQKLGYQGETSIFEHKNDSKTTELINVAHLDVDYIQKTNWLGKPTSIYKGLQDVSFQLFKGESLALVGESGSGKSTIGKTLLGLQKATAGNIYYNNLDLSNCSNSDWIKVRRSIQIIFQDPFSSLNPRIKVGRAIQEPIEYHQIAKGDLAKEKVMNLLALVGLPNDAYEKYPHEFSGGQRQRVCIARALAVEPEIIICDESVSALDVKIQAQVLNLLYKLQIEKNLTYLFITHDMSVVKRFCNRMIVLRKGQIVEEGPTLQVLANPQMDYTQQLIASIPK